MRGMGFAYLCSWLIVSILAATARWSEHKHTHTHTHSYKSMLIARTDLATLFNGCLRNWSSRLNDFNLFFGPPKSDNAEIKSIARSCKHSGSEYFHFHLQLTVKPFAFCIQCLTKQRQQQQMATRPVHSVLLLVCSAQLMCIISI